MPWHGLILSRDEPSDKSGTIQVDDVDKPWALRSRLEIPLAHIACVEVDSDERRVQSRPVHTHSNRRFSNRTHFGGTNHWWR